MAINCGNVDCKKRIRKGMGRRALVFSDKGGMKLALVCPGCFGNMVPVVPPVATTIPSPCQTPGCKGFGEYCGPCVARLAKQNHELTNANTVLSGHKHKKGAKEG